MCVVKAAKHLPRLFSDVWTAALIKFNAISQKQFCQRFDQIARYSGFLLASHVNRQQKTENVEARSWESFVIHLVYCFHYIATGILRIFPQLVCLLVDLFLSGITQSCVWSVMKLLEGWGLRPNNQLFLSTKPKSTSLRESASFQPSCAKIRWRVWPVGVIPKQKGHK